MGLAASRRSNHGETLFSKLALSRRSDLQNSRYGFRSYIRGGESRTMSGAKSSACIARNKGEAQMNNTREYLCVAEPGFSTPSASYLNPLLSTCFKRIRSWRVPPNCAPFQWFEEVLQVASIAAWQAAVEYNPWCDGSFSHFVEQRVIARALNYYRREWNYSLRFAPDDLQSESDASDSQTGKVAVVEAQAGAGNAATILEELRDAISSLSADQREIIEELFWNGFTEVEIGQMLGLTQRTVSRRKRAAIQSLRRCL